MEKSVIGTGPVSMMPATPSTTLNRTNAASIKNLLNSGKLDHANAMALQTKLTAAKRLQSQLLAPVANPRIMKAAIGDLGDSFPAEDTLSDVEAAITTAANVYQAVTNQPAPVVVTPTSRVVVQTPGNYIMGIPAPVVIVGGLVLTGLLMYAFID